MIVHISTGMLVRVLVNILINALILIHILVLVNDVIQLLKQRQPAEESGTRVWVGWEEGRELGCIIW
jgi:hypothetical protein